MREVMEQSSDKVLENALANGGESHTHTYMLRVLITSYRNSLSKCIEAPGYMHIANELLKLCSICVYTHTNIHSPTHTHLEITQPALIPLLSISLLHGGSRTDQQLSNMNQANQSLWSLSPIRPRHESESCPVTPESLPQVSEGYFICWQFALWAGVQCCVTLHIKCAFLQCLCPCVFWVTPLFHCVVFSIVQFVVSS